MREGEALTVEFEASEIGGYLLCQCLEVHRHGPCVYSVAQKWLAIREATT